MIDFPVFEKCVEFYLNAKGATPHSFAFVVATSINGDVRLGTSHRERCSRIAPKFDAIVGFKKKGNFSESTVRNLLKAEGSKSVGSPSNGVALAYLALTDEAFLWSKQQIEASDLFGEVSLFDIYSRYHVKAKLELGLLIRPNLRSAEQPYGPQDAILHYAYDDSDKIEVLGRDKEQENLRTFLRDDRKFLWVQLAGAAGQGKSRLAWELIREEHSKQDQGFDAGYMRGEDLAEFANGWAVWQPHKPTLIVIDYVYEADKKIGVPMAIMASRCEELDHPVRFLLLERQRWNRSGVRGVKTSSQKSVSGHAARGGKNGGLERTSMSEADFDLSMGNALWFGKLEEELRTYFKSPRDQLGLENARLNSPDLFYGNDGVIELKALKPEQLREIAKQVAKRENRQVKIRHSDDKIEATLKRFDGSGRPLYAYFLGLVIADGHLPSDWQLAQFLDQVLTLYQRKHWSSRLNGNPPELSDSNAGLYLAVVATIIRLLNKGALKDWPFEKLQATSDYPTALAITGAPIGDGIGGSGSAIPGMLPDLLGEWFVLRFFEEQPQLIQTLICWCWEVDPAATADFLRRIAEDFPKENMPIQLWTYLVHVQAKQPSRHCSSTHRQL